METPFFVLFKNVNETKAAVKSKTTSYFLKLLITIIITAQINSINKKP